MNNILELQKIEAACEESANKEWSTLSVAGCQNGGGN